MEVAAAEAKGAHAGPPRCGAGMEPGAGPGVEVEGRLIEMEVRIHLVGLEGGRQRLVLQGKHGLDQAGRPGGGFGMADHGFHRPDRAARRGFGGTEKLGQGLDFDFVADPRPRAMGLDEFDRFGRYPGGRIRLVQGLELALGPGGVNALGFAVAAGADPFHNGQDAIAVGLGIGQALQNQNADALAQHGAVGMAGKGPRIAAGRENLGAGEAHVHEDIVEGIHAARDHHPGLARVKLHQGQMDGAHRAGAGRIHHAVGAAEIEAVADPAGDHIPQEAGEGIFLPGHVAVGEPLHDLSGLFVVDPGAFEGPAPLGPAQAGTEGDDELLGAGHPQNDGGAIPFEIRFFAVAGLIEGRFGRQQGKDLRRVGGREIGRRNPEGGGIEGNRGEEAAAPAIHVVRLAGIRVIVIVGRPMAGGYVPDGVFAVIEEVPVGF